MLGIYSISILFKKKKIFVVNVYSMLGIAGTSKTWS